MENIYLIYGSDYSLIKRRINLIKKDNQELVRYDLTECNVSELIDDASSISMFGEEKLLIGENALFLTSNVDPISHNLDYLEKYFGFRTAYCNLHIKYRPGFERLFKVLDRFRNVFLNFDQIGIFHQLNAVLKMEAYVRNK